MTDPSQPMTTLAVINVQPSATGSAGDQVPVISGPIAASTSPRGGQAERGNLGAVLGAHIDTRSPYVMAFAVAAYRDGEATREVLAAEIRRTSDDRDNFRERFYEEAKASAVLNTQLRLTTKFKRFQKWAFGLGAILLGAAVGSALQVSDLTWRDGLLALVGLLVMWVGSPLFEEGD